MRLNNFGFAYNNYLKLIINKYYQADLGLTRNNGLECFLGTELVEWPVESSQIKPDINLAKPPTRLANTSITDAYANVNTGCSSSSIVSISHAQHSCLANNSPSYSYFCLQVLPVDLYVFWVLDLDALVWFLFSTHYMACVVCYFGLLET